MSMQDYFESLDRWTDGVARSARASERGLVAQCADLESLLARRLGNDVRAADLSSAAWQHNFPQDYAAQAERFFPSEDRLRERFVFPPEATAVECESKPTDKLQTIINMFTPAPSDEFVVKGFDSSREGNQQKQ